MTRTAAPPTSPDVALLRLQVGGRAARIRRRFCGHRAAASLASWLGGVGDLLGGKALPDVLHVEGADRRDDLFEPGGRQRTGL